MYDWEEYFKSVKKVPLITQQHHFVYTSEAKGTMTVRQHSDLSDVVHMLTTDLSFACEPPEIIVPDGLFLKQKWYLHDKICEYCPDDVKDLVCPKRSPVTSSPPGHEDPPPQKKDVPVDSGVGGHNRCIFPSLNPPTQD